MPTGASARLGLDAPLGTEQVLQGDDLFRAWRLALEARAAMYQLGTAAARPAAATANIGMTYHASDTGVAYISTGATWRVLGGYVGQCSFSPANFAPDGFLVCAGQPISANNQELRDWLIARGNPWGTSGGLPLAPPAQGRAPVAAGSGAGLTPRTVGQTFGEENHLITEGESWPHFHEMRAQTGIGGGIAIDAPGQAGRVSQGGADPITGPGSTEYAGGNPQARMNVTQPSVVLTMLIQAR
jgi:microcystin-dependent protein